AQRPQDGFALGAIAVGSGDQDVVAALAAGDVDSTDDLGEELAVDVGQDDADRAGPAGDQAARGSVRRVPHLLDGATDALARLRADRALLVEHARDRGRGDAREARD